MPIIFHAESETFHLCNKQISYLMSVMPNHHLEHLYFGTRITDRNDYSYIHEEKNQAHAVMASEDGSYLNMQIANQEYPCYGTGDYRSHAFAVLQEDGSRLSDFQYVTHVIKRGKKPIPNLPATYVEDEKEATTLEVFFEDVVSQTGMVMSYTIYEELPVITRSIKFQQISKEEVRLEKALSMSMDFPGHDFDLIHLAGAWSRERYLKRHALCEGSFRIESVRGISSAEHNPFMALARKNTDEMQGEVYGFSLIYSGNFVGEAQVSSHGATRIQMGIHPEGFSWPLSKGESFYTPEVVMVYSDKGFNGMSEAFHKLYGSRLARGYWRDRERPILLNNWEATYMDFDEEKILSIARKGKEAGVELFVLDDGWFGERNDDTAGLGDWFVNTDKLPDGIAGLSKKITDMGLLFGLWIEPEMVNKNSKLYREHPDWLLTHPNRKEGPSRNQFVLDFSRNEVVDAVYEMLTAVLDEAKVSYIKWDMNRYLSDVYSRTLPADLQGTVLHRYILNVYNLYERLLQRYPEMLFESCASGGARFDPGMLYYAPQAWCSDDTDANERVKIQYGTSYVYPISATGAHVSAVPNHQLMRETPLETRAYVAFYGAFGYELDLNMLPDEEFKQVQEQIAFYKKYRKLFQFGRFYRMENPFLGNNASWMVVDEKASEAMAMYYQRLNHVNDARNQIRFVGLKEDTLYRVSYRLYQDVVVVERFGSELMQIGILLQVHWCPAFPSDYTALLFHIEEIYS